MSLRPSLFYLFDLPPQKVSWEHLWMRLWVSRLSIQHVELAPNEKKQKKDLLRSFLTFEWSVDLFTGEQAGKYPDANDALGTGYKGRTEAAFDPIHQKKGRATVLALVSALELIGVSGKTTNTI